MFKVAFLCTFLSTISFLWSAPPDLTKKDFVPQKSAHDWNLGATGAKGWIFSERLSTSAARQILITQVEKGSPAHGKLEIGDVILGVGESKFASDPRVVFGEAVSQAEVTSGLLALLCWRNDKVFKSELKL